MISERGWNRIGPAAGTGHRSLWSRITLEPGVGAVCVELRAGRDGEDGYVKIERDNPQFSAIEEVISIAEFAAEWQSNRLDEIKAAAVIIASGTAHDRSLTPSEVSKRAIAVATELVDNLHKMDS